MNTPSIFTIGKSLHFAAALVLLAVPGITNAQVSSARYANLARGVNIDNWFQNSSTFSVTSADVTLLKNAGFTYVRVPVAPNYVLPHYASSTTISNNLTNLDAAIDLFLNAGMGVTLDFHADSAYITYYLANPSTAPQELVTFWQSMATRYASKSFELLFFEVMNEPDNRFTQAQWDTEQTQVIAAIHAITAQRTVLASPVNWSGIDALTEMTPYADLNVIYVMHDYYPPEFTRQGYAPAGSPYQSMTNVPYPSYLPALQTLISQTSDTTVKNALLGYQSQDWNAQTVAWPIQLAAAWARYWNVRVVINEFGVYKTYAPADSRARWIYDMQTAMAANGIGWALWDYEAGFDLVTGVSGSRSIDPAIGGALGLTSFTFNTSYPARTGAPPAFTGLRSVQVSGAPLLTGFGEGIQVADLNADTLPDVIVTATNYPTAPDYPVQIFLNQGGGVMASAPFTGPVPTTEYVDVIVPGKFDNSGRLGVFFPDMGRVYNNGPGTQSRLVLPAANNTFTDATSKLPQQVVSTMGGAAGDADGDGVDDLVVFYNTVPSRALPMQLLHNDGTGNFAVSAAAFPAFVSDLARTDNQFVCGTFVQRPGPGVRDLVAIGLQSPNGRVFLNDGTGRFSAGSTLPATATTNGGPITGGCVATADINGDGYLDLVVGYQRVQGGSADQVQILINNGDGSFRDETLSRIGPLPASGNVLRRLSLVPRTEGAGFALLLSSVYGSPVMYVDGGDGIFRSTSSFASQSLVQWAFAAADFNKDGWLDLAYAEGGNGPTVQMRFGQAPLLFDGAAPASFLRIVKSHTGNFALGQSNAVYTVTVSNTAGAAATSGTVTVTETVPAGMTLVSMSGTGWTCPASGTTCTRSDVLAAGSSYPPIIVTVSIASNAALQLTNQVSVSGGGSSSASASDATTISTTCPITISPLTPAVAATAGTLTLAITGGSCGWTAQSNASWLTPAVSSGTATTLNVTVAANATGAQRSGTLTVAGQTITVTQAGNTALQIPSLVSLNPFQGSGANAVLTFVYGHPNGWSAIRSAEFIINPRWESTTRAGGCYVKYSPGTGLFTLIADDGSNVAGSSAPGSATSLSNSQCTLNTATSTVTGSGTTLTIQASLTFTPSFSGQRHIWMQAVDYNNFSTNWLVYGVWFPTQTSVSAIPWYRIYDPNSRSYLYSADQNEYNTLGSLGFTLQGTSGLVMNGATTVGGISNIAWYRVYVNVTSSHFWTSDRNEFLSLVNAQQAYVGEGVAAFVMPYINAQGLVSPQVTNTIPFYRAAFQGANLHFWTSDPNEFFGTNGGHLPTGYFGEGIACYIFPASGAQFSQPFTPAAQVAPAEVDDGSTSVVSVANGASHTRNGVIAPGQALTIFGRHLGGTVLLNGVAAQVIDAQDDKIRVLVPNDLAGATEVTVAVEHRGHRTRPVKLSVVPADPAIFGTNAFGRGNAQARNEDGTENGPEQAAARGSLVTLYTTGYAVGDLPVEVHIGGYAAEVVSAHPSGTRLGVIEVQVRVPQTVDPAPFQPVVLHVGNLFSQPGVGLAIR